MSNYAVEKPKIIFRTLESQKVLEGKALKTTFELSIFAYAERITNLLKSSHQSNPIRAKVLTGLNGKINYSKKFLLLRKKETKALIESARESGFAIVQVQPKLKEYEILFVSNYANRTLNLIKLLDEVIYDLKCLEITGLISRKEVNKITYDSQRSIRSLMSYGYELISKLYKKPENVKMLETSEMKFDYKDYNKDNYESIYALIGEIKK